MPHFDGANVGTSEPALGDSYYNALQVKWDKRFSDGVSLLAHYTWSKMIDNASHASGNVSWLGGSTNIQNIWDLDSERALSSHDVAHRVVVTGVWQLPFGRDRTLGLGLESPFRRAPWRVGHQRRVLPAERHAPLRHTIGRSDLGRHTAPEPRRRSQHFRPHDEPARQLLQRRRFFPTADRMSLAPLRATSTTADRVSGSSTRP